MSTYQDIYGHIKTYKDIYGHIKTYKEEQVQEDSESSEDDGGGLQRCT